MDDVNSARWWRALIGRILLGTLCGAVLCGLSGGCWGLVCGGGYNWHLGAELPSDQGDVPVSLLQLYPGIAVGAFLGLWVGLLQGLLLFFFGGWCVSPRVGPLLQWPGPFWTLARSVAVGQAGGVIGCVALSCLWVFICFRHAGQGAVDSVQCSLDAVLWAAPAGLFFGGFVGGMGAINRLLDWHVDERQPPTLISQTTV